MKIVEEVTKNIGENMGHKCFISYKKEDQKYRNRLDRLLNASDVINKGLDREIKSYDADYIMRIIRQDYLADSTVTIFLIGEHSSENEGKDDKGRHHNYFIQRELQASLYNGDGNTRNGILGVVLPSMYDSIYGESKTCRICGKKHKTIHIDDSTVIREFSANYHIGPDSSCTNAESDRYCVLVKWSSFIQDPEKYIDIAYKKRSSKISGEVRIRKLRDEESSWWMGIVCCLLGLGLLGLVHLICKGQERR